MRCGMYSVSTTKPPRCDGGGAQRSTVSEASVDYDALVADLAVRHRTKVALRALMAAGPHATPAVRRGLQHSDATIRAECCNILDHFLDESALPELMANLEDPDAHVRARALHALACDRCKEGSCRPGETTVIPIALDMLALDPDRGVRKSAVEMLGPSAHKSAEVRAALLKARTEDADPLVRKVAGWHCPGGRIYEGLPSRTGRRRATPPRDTATK